MGKFKKNFIVLADHATTEKDGKFMISGVFETIYATALPAMHPSLYVVGNFFVEDKNTLDAKVDLDVIGPNGKSIVEVAIPPLNAKVPEIDRDKRAFNIIYQLTNVKIVEYGEHHILVKIDGEDIGFTIFFVEKPSN